MSRQRRMALAAHEAVQAFKKSTDQSKLRTLCMKTPSLIHQSGLAQALVFLRSREGQIGRDFVNALAKVHEANGFNGNGQALVNDALAENDLQKYMVLTSAIADVAAWMRRFAQIELKEED